MINTQYNEEIIKKIKKQLTKQDFPSISLPDFFTKKTYHELKKTATQAKYTHEKQPEKYSQSKTTIEYDLQELQKFLAKILAKPIKKLTPTAYKYEWKDYAIMHDKNKTTGTDIIISLTTDENELVTYYQDGIHHKIIPEENTITITKRKNTQRYVKYVNHKTKTKQFILIEV